jgi:hypothetical protein
MDTNKDEIDLMEVLTGIKLVFQNFFLRLIRAIIFFRNITFQNIIMIISLGVGAGVVGFVLDYNSSQLYQSSMIIHSSYINNGLMSSSIEKINTLCQDNNSVELSNLLGVDSVKTKNIRSISFETILADDEILRLKNLQNKIKMEDEDAELYERVIKAAVKFNGQNYKVKLITNDYSDYAEFGKGFLSYLGNNSYISKRLKIDRDLLMMRSENIELEIKKMNEFKKVVFEKYDLKSDRNIGGSNNVILAEENKLNPISVYNESRNLYAENLNIKKELYLDSGFEVVDGFSSFSKLDEDNNLVIIFSMFGVCIAYFFLLIKYFNRYLNKVEEGLGVD